MNSTPPPRPAPAPTALAAADAGAEETWLSPKQALRVFPSHPIVWVVVAGGLLSIVFSMYWLFAPGWLAIPWTTTPMLPIYAIFGVLCVAMPRKRLMPVFLMCLLGWVAIQAFYIYVGFPDMTDVIDAEANSAIEGTEFVPPPARHQEFADLARSLVWLLLVFIPGTIVAGAGLLMPSARRTRATGSAAVPGSAAPVSPAPGVVTDGATGPGVSGQGGSPMMQPAPITAESLTRLLDAALPIRRAQWGGRKFTSPTVLIAVAVGFLGHMAVWLAGTAWYGWDNITAREVSTAAIFTAMAVLFGVLIAYLLQRASWGTVALLVIPAAMITMVTASAATMSGPVICISCFVQPGLSPMLVAGFMMLVLLIAAPTPPAPDPQALALVARSEGINVFDEAPQRFRLGKRTRRGIIALGVVVLIFGRSGYILREQMYSMWPLSSSALAVAAVVFALWVSQQDDARVRRLMLGSFLAWVVGSVAFAVFYRQEDPEYWFNALPTTVSGWGYAWESAAVLVVGLVLATLVVAHARRVDIQWQVWQHHDAVRAAAAAHDAAFTHSTSGGAGTGAATGLGPDSDTATGNATDTASGSSSTGEDAGPAVAD